MALRLVIPIKQRVCLTFHALHKRLLWWVKPQATALLLGMLAALRRGKSELLAENALVRQQLLLLHRQIKRPVDRKTDWLLLLRARMGSIGKQALFLVQPETLLRWQRELLRVFRKHTSQARSSKPRLASPVRKRAALVFW